MNANINFVSFSLIVVSKVITWSFFEGSKIQSNAAKYEHQSENFYPDVNYRV